MPAAVEACKQRKGMSAVVENNEQETEDRDLESDVISDEDAPIKPVIIRMFDLHQNNRPFSKIKILCFVTGAHRQEGKKNQRCNKKLGSYRWEICACLIFPYGW